MASADALNCTVRGILLSFFPPLFSNFYLEPCLEPTIFARE